MVADRNREVRRDGQTSGQKFDRSCQMTTCGAFLGLVSALAVLGGFGTGTLRAQVSVRDSAGVQIIENGPVDLGRHVWRLSDEPVFRVGWEEDEPAFGYVIWGVLLPGDRVIVADATPPRVFTISPRGQVIAQYGRQGEGPGEFASIGGGTHLGGDTLLFEDDRAIRLTLYHDGEFVRQVSLRSRQSPSTRIDVLDVIGTTPDGAVLLAERPSATASSEETWGSAALVTMSRDGEQFDTIATYDARPPEALEWGSFTPIGSVDVSGSEWIVTARGDRPEVRWLDRTGMVRRIARWDLEPLAMTDGFRSDYRRFLRDRVPAGQLDEAIGSLRGPLAYFVDVRGDSGGNAWLRSAEALYRDPERYFVVSEDGRWLGAIDIPERLQVLDIGADRILVVERDEYEVHAVAVYRLEPVAEPGLDR